MIRENNYGRGCHRFCPRGEFSVKFLESWRLWVTYDDVMKVIERYSNLREQLVSKLVEFFPTIKASRVSCSGNFLKISENLYVSWAHLRSGLTHCLVDSVQILFLFWQNRSHFWWIFAVFFRDFWRNFWWIFPEISDRIKVLSKRVTVTCLFTLRTRLKKKTKREKEKKRRQRPHLHPSPLEPEPRWKIFWLFLDFFGFFFWFSFDFFLTFFSFLNHTLEIIEKQWYILVWISHS